MAAVASEGELSHPFGVAESGSPQQAPGIGFNAHLMFNSARGHKDDSKSDKLRSKLVDVGQRFIGFDKVVEEDTICRKDVENKRIEDARSGLVKLEKALNVEIKRRVEANKTVQEMTETLANGMLDRLQSKILARIEKLTVSLDSLTTRCGALESGISSFKGELPTKLSVDTAALIKEIDTLRKKRRDRARGNMRFIGQLFLRSLLGSRIIESIIKDLAKCQDADVAPEEAIVECLCELLQNTGFTLERSGAAGQASLSKVCDKLCAIKSNYSKRIQFGIQDVLDIRAAGWKKKTFKASAKTKGEIRREQEQDLWAQACGQEVQSAEVQIAGARRPVTAELGNSVSWVMSFPLSCSKSQVANSA